MTCRVHCKYGACEADYLRPHRYKAGYHWVRLHPCWGSGADVPRYWIPGDEILVRASEFDYGLPS